VKVHIRRVRSTWPGRFPTIDRPAQKLERQPPANPGRSHGARRNVSTPAGSPSTPVREPPLTAGYRRWRRPGPVTAGLKPENRAPRTDSVYVRGIHNTEIVHAVHERPAPMIPATHSL
jgi:hypothetical protein